MPDVLIYADTLRSGEMRHEVPLMIPDPFLYAEVAGKRHVVASAPERPRLTALDGGIEVRTLEEFGFDELLVRGAERHEALLEIAVRACRELGITAGAVPGEFPLELGDRLRAAGVAVAPDRHLFESRRRVKSESELSGIRRAQAAAEAGMRAAVELLRAAEPHRLGLVVEDEPLTCERLKLAVRDALATAGASGGEDFIVSHGAQTAVGHELGSGPLEAGEAIVIDLWPRDPESACFADMTRTFVVGDVPDELRRYHDLTHESLERSREAIRAGAVGRDVYGLACEPFERAGLPTQRTKAAGEVLERGFHHSLGHGVGLDIHEPPVLGRGADVLVAGDVVTLEPGCYRPGFGGCRLEDLAYVTAEGCEVLTRFPYGLKP